MVASLLFAPRAHPQSAYSTRPGARLPPDMAVTDLREICLDQRMPPQVRKYIEAHCTARLKKQAGRRQ